MRHSDVVIVETAIVDAHWAWR